MTAGGRGRRRGAAPASGGDSGGGGGGALPGPCDSGSTRGGPPAAGCGSPGGAAGRRGRAALGSGVAPCDRAGILHTGYATCMKRYIYKIMKYFQVPVTQPTPLPWVELGLKIVAVWKPALGDCVAPHGRPGERVRLMQVEQMSGVLSVPAFAANMGAAGLRVRPFRNVQSCSWCSQPHRAHLV